MLNPSMTPRSGGGAQQKRVARQQMDDPETKRSWKRLRHPMTASRNSAKRVKERLQRRRMRTARNDVGGGARLTLVGELQFAGAHYAEDGLRVRG